MKYAKGPIGNLDPVVKHVYYGECSEAVSHFIFLNSQWNTESMKGGIGLNLAQLLLEHPLVSAIHLDFVL